MNTRGLLFSLLVVLAFAPAGWSASSNDARNTVVAEIATNRGPSSVTLVRKGDGFVGPRGEYYPSFPSKKTLEAVYGGGSGSSSPKPTATPKSTPKPVSGEITVKAFEGGVRLLRDGKFYREIRTVRPDVRGWKLVRSNSEIVIKSGIGREPGIVELFNVSSGERLGRVKSTDVKDGKPAWAKNFAE